MYQLVTIRTPLPHGICCSPSQAVKALVQLVHLFGNSIYNFWLLEKDCWLGQHEEFLRGLQHLMWSFCCNPS